MHMLRWSLLMRTKDRHKQTAMNSEQTHKAHPQHDSTDGKSAAVSASSTPQGIYTGFFLLYNPETTNPAKVTEMTSLVTWRWPEDHEGGLQSGTKCLGDHGSYSFSSSTEGATAYECVELIKVHIWNGHFTADVNYTSRNRQRPVVGCLSGTYGTLVQSPSPLVKIYL